MEYVEAGLSRTGHYAVAQYWACKTMLSLLAGKVESALEAANLPALTNVRMRCLPCRTSFLCIAGRGSPGPFRHPAAGHGVSAGSSKPLLLLASARTGPVDASPCSALSRPRGWMEI